MIVCELDNGDEYEMEHSILVEKRTGDGSIRIATHAGEVSIPEYAVRELLRAVKEANNG